MEKLYSNALKITSLFRQAIDFQPENKIREKLSCIPIYIGIQQLSCLQSQLIDQITETLPKSKLTTTTI
jgi:cadmium resistance protein CadD (predicted permease)